MGQREVLTVHAFFRPVMSEQQSIRVSTMRICRHVSDLKKLREELIFSKFV